MSKIFLCTRKTNNDNGDEGGAKILLLTLWTTVGTTLGTTLGITLGITLRIILDTT